MSAPKPTLVTRARACQTGEECIALYAEWAPTYNSDLVSESEFYVAPAIAAQTALQVNLHAEGVAILDAGCGTGLVGEALTRGGARVIDGLDLSPDMLQVAEKTGVYRNLQVGNLKEDVKIKDESYDVVTCVGTFTHGHVGPDPALKTFVRLTKTGGKIVVTVLEEIWLSGGFKREVEKLEAEGLVKVVSLTVEDYIQGRGDKMRLVVLEKIVPPSKRGNSSVQSGSAGKQEQEVTNGLVFRADQPLLKVTR